MAKSKYAEIRKKLPVIEKWVRDGLSEGQIAKNLGISRSTLNTYKQKFPDFLDTIKKGREVFIAEVENALAKRALGFFVNETKTYVKLEDGKEVTYQEKTEKYVAPDVAACSILLKNKDRGNWSDNPIKADLEKEYLEFKKEVERMKTF